MPDKYIVEKTDLTNVANAIRAKGETSGQLVFPSEFVTAIQEIRTGADLNFEIVGGTTQPSNPKENTIWVNTSNEITGWNFGAEEYRPTSSSEGMIWIVSSNTSPANFNAITENAIIISIRDAYQYISGSWVKFNMKIY